MSPEPDDFSDLQQSARQKVAQWEQKLKSDQATQREETRNSQILRDTIWGICVRFSTATGSIFEAGSGASECRVICGPFSASVAISSARDSKGNRVRFSTSDDIASDQLVLDGSGKVTFWRSVARPSFAERSEEIIGKSFERQWLETRLRDFFATISSSEGYALYQKALERGRQYLWQMALAYIMALFAFYILCSGGWLVGWILGAVSGAIFPFTPISEGQVPSGYIRSASANASQVAANGIHLKARVLGMAAFVVLGPIAMLSRIIGILAAPQVIKGLMQPNLRAPDSGFDDSGGYETKVGRIDSDGNIYKT